MIAISSATPDEYDAIRRIVTDAFDDSFEAELIDACRTSLRFDPDLSIAARENGNIVGYSLFTPVRVGDDWGACLVLAPIAVAPSRQGNGIGAKLLRTGFERGRERGYRAVVLHGDPRYYGRFGFEPAERYGIENPLETPSEVFVARELVPDGLEDVAGKVRYLPAFEAML